jgi:hypothetical protein
MVMSGMDPHMISLNPDMGLVGLVGLLKWIFVRLWVGHGETP